MKSRKTKKTFTTAIITLVALAAIWLGAANRTLAETSQTEPTAWWWYHGVSGEFISQAIANDNARIVDLEVEGTAPYRFSAAMVKNEGVHAKAWWWYYGLTLDGLFNLLQQHQARILDLEVYLVDGQQRLAVVLVPNTGTQGKAWWFYYNVQPDFIAQKINETGGRIIDLDTYVVGNTRYHSMVLIANQGEDAKSWWYYYNVTPDFITAKLEENQARLVDIEPHAAGTFTVVMEKSQGEYWWWYYGLSASELSARVAQTGARIIDLEPYTVYGEKRFAAVLLNNSNALTTRVGEILRQATLSLGGTSGLYLKQVNGPVLAALQERKVFEPASTIKVLHHLHAMRQVQSGAANLSEYIPFFTNYVQDANGSNTSCPADTRLAFITLGGALQQMMLYSDNRMTEAIKDRFTQAAINATAQAIGMNDTSLNHKLGCGGPALQAPNRLTLFDVGLLYEGVANGSLLTPANRTTFYALMNNSVFARTLEVIDDEINKLVEAQHLSQAEQDALRQDLRKNFRDKVKMVSKAGNYDFCQTNDCARSEWVITIGGWLQLPFRKQTKLGALVVPQQYVFGIFINDAIVNNDAEKAQVNEAFNQAQSELHREQIRAGLKTFLP